MSSMRTERLKEVIREESAQAILHDLVDPRIGFCTVTRVDLTNDLSYCTIHVSVLGSDAEKRTTMAGLTNARGLIQARIAKRMKTRTTPHVTIELDESIEKSFSVISKIQEARATDTDAGKDTATAEDPDDEKDIDDDVEDVEDVADDDEEEEKDDDEKEDDAGDDDVKPGKKK